eukprot:scaffold49817_cov17-Tisochrysis_lutea.AAC.1
MALIGEKEGRSEALVRRTREQCNESLDQIVRDRGLMRKANCLAIRLIFAGSKLNQHQKRHRSDRNQGN